MTLYSWGTNWGPFERLRGEMNRLFDRSFLGRDLLPGWLEHRERFARVNMAETAEALTVECELPGVRKEDIDISVEGGTLIIRGERKPPGGRQAERYDRRERAFGPFERTLELPARVDVEQVKAKLTSGVLEIVLPRHPDSKPKRIEVNVG